MTTTALALHFTLPMPPSTLGPNGTQAGWQKRMRLKEDYRQSCFDAIAARVARCGYPDALPLRRVWISLAFRYCGRQKLRDHDNALACVKVGIDCLVRAGVIADDSPEHLSYAQLEADHCLSRCHCGGKVLVEVEER